MIEIEGEILRTEREWERRHRHVLKSQRGKGVERTWRAHPGNVTATWYREEQTKPWTKRELRAAARARAAERARKHDEEVAAKARMEGEVELLRRICGEYPIDGCPHTACQWVEAGFVPLDGAKWRLGDPAEGQSDGYFYCQAHDVRYRPRRAAELLEKAPWNQPPPPVWARKQRRESVYLGAPWW